MTTVELQSLHMRWDKKFKEFGQYASVIVQIFANTLYEQYSLYVSAKNGLL